MLHIKPTESNIKDSSPCKTVELKSKINSVRRQAAANYQPITRVQNMANLGLQPVLTSQKHPSDDDSNDPGSTK